MKANKIHVYLYYQYRCTVIIIVNVDVCLHIIKMLTQGSVKYCDSVSDDDAVLQCCGGATNMARLADAVAAELS